MKDPKNFKDPKKKASQRTDLMILYIMVMLAMVILLSIAIYGLEAKTAVENARHDAKIEEIDQQRSAREAAREKEWAEARQELHEDFYKQKMEEARAKAENFQTRAVILQDFHEEFDQAVSPLAIETLELKIGAGTMEVTEAETEEPETITEETEDDSNKETEKVSEKVETTETEPKEAEITLIEAETEENEDEDDWFETQPIVEQQPEVKNDEPIPEPSVVSTPISYQENSNVNVSLQDFLNYNGMSLEDFIIRMTCMVYPEACGEGFTGKQGVAEVAMNWIYSGMKTEWWDISSGFANIPVQRYYELMYSQNEYEQRAIKECRQAVEEVINGAHPVEDLLGVKPYYFLLPEKSDPINVYVMLQATYQIWIGNQLYLGMEGIDWTLKGN